LIPTREAGLQRLEAFLPKAAKYAGTRNFDFGTENHQGVSQLSPYIRTRLITEEEATRAVLGQHSARAAEKFLQEIAWRTYWKGWLEMRPQVWSDYQSSLPHIAKFAGYDIAVSGKTGIECFDHWVEELLDSGYLHNHARMWFVSIWIFTLKLPWQLGADFFLRHLLDADPAVNTLSWRWVAGLHTPGKHYLARAANIETYTNGRFNPIGQLDETAKPIAMDGIYERQALELPENPRLSGRIGHLMFPDDLAEPPGEIGTIVATAAFLPESLKTSTRVTDFLHGAIASTLDERGGVPLNNMLEDLEKWIIREKLYHIVYSLPTVGPTKDYLSSQRLPQIAQPFVRDWDRNLWPKATAGFFKIKEALPKIHASLI
jgi:deoxyribodipyrimidine photo-lyase